MDNGKIVLSLGSNTGNRIKNLEKGLKIILKSGVMIEGVSSFYETSPVDNFDQPPFVNIAVSGRTIYTPFELIDRVQEIEKYMGRKRLISKGPRNIDIDIIFYDRLVVSTNTLVLPHPSFSKRMFVLEPISELIPDFIPPCRNKTISELMQVCSDNVSNPQKLNYKSKIFD